MHIEHNAIISSFEFNEALDNRTARAVFILFTKIPISKKKSFFMLVYVLQQPLLYKYKFVDTVHFGHG